MIPNTPTSCKLYFQFDLQNNPPLAAVDTDYGWSLFQGEDAMPSARRFAIAIYEFVTRYVDLSDSEQNPPDEAA